MHVPISMYEWLCKTNDFEKAFEIKSYVCHGLSPEWWRQKRKYVYRWNEKMQFRDLSNAIFVWGLQTQQLHSYKTDLE